MLAGGDIDLDAILGDLCELEEAQIKNNKKNTDYKI